MEPFSVLGIVFSLLLGSYAADYRSDMSERDKWSPEDHVLLMKQCRSICGRDRVGSYDPVDLCTCSKKRRR